MRRSNNQKPATTAGFNYLQTSKQPFEGHFRDKETLRLPMEKLPKPPRYALIILRSENERGA